MLILSRKIGQKIVIGEGQDAVTVCVTSIDRDTVKLGFDAPKSIRVDRMEVAIAKLNSAIFKDFEAND
jgi:carbon storage regulator